MTYAIGLGSCQYEIVHKNCGARVEPIKYLAGFYSCWRCNAIVHHEQTEQKRITIA